jgi:hypothetical protein
MQPLTTSAELLVYTGTGLSKNLFNNQPNPALSFKKEQIKITACGDVLAKLLPETLKYKFCQPLSCEMNNQCLYLYLTNKTKMETDYFYSIQPKNIMQAQHNN